MSGSAPGDPSVALVTCAEYPEGYVDDRTVVAPLAREGIVATFAVWDDPAVDWEGFDLVVLRSTWDYPPRRHEFLAWAAAVPNLVNSIGVVRWSSDKRYLRHLEAQGAPCVPTTFVEPGGSRADIASAVTTVAASSSRLVVKPSIGAGSLDAGRFESADDASLEQAVKHAGAIVERGHAVMIQPYVEGIDTSGETALVFLNGEFSHAIRKEPILSGGVAQFDGLFADERTSPMSPSDGERAAAEDVLDAVPFDRTSLLYGRVDLLPGPHGQPLLLELELVEPSLFLLDVAGAAERFAAVIAKRLRA